MLTMVICPSLLSTLSLSQSLHLPLLSCKYYRYDSNKSSESVGYRESKTQAASCQNPGTKLCHRLHARGDKFMIESPAS